MVHKAQPPDTFFISALVKANSPKFDNLFIVFVKRLTAIVKCLKIDLFELANS